MIYELRIYYIHPGRMQNILNRFSDHTLGIFGSHGIKVTDFWVDAEGKDIIYYICEFENLDAKVRAWSSFTADPEWKSVKSKSEEDGPIVKKVDSFVMETAAFFKR